MQYPIAIEHGDETTATGIFFPDIPNAMTAGDTIEKAYAMAVEVAHIQLEVLAAEGKTPPLPSKMEDLKGLPEYQGMGWDMIEIDVTPYMAN
jgi:predicted RNase H-like HicB family nuclease